MKIKLLNLKISPLISNENNDFILFEGITNISDNIIITLIDYEKDKNDEEKIVIYSSTNFEKNNLDVDVNLLPLKKYILIENNYNTIISKIFSINISLKLYNIYEITLKNKLKKKYTEKSIFLIKDSTLQDNSNIKFTKLEKIIDENVSQSSIFI